MERGVFRIKFEAYTFLEFVIMASRRSLGLDRRIAVRCQWFQANVIR